MAKRHGNKEPVPVMPQRYTWKTVATYDNYEEASLLSVENPHNRPLKIKRRSDCYDVRLGTPVKKD